MKKLLFHNISNNIKQIYSYLRIFIIGGEIKINHNEFLWYAKRGHEECILALENNLIYNYKGAVRKVVLNNYGFLKDGEYRSSYAYQLASFYNDNSYFVNLICGKLVRTDLNDDYTFEYLVNNLYFFLKGKKYKNIEKKIEKLLVKLLSKERYSVEEGNSISSIVSLIIDLNMNIAITDIINKYYLEYMNSNLDLSSIEFNYNILFDKKIRNDFSFDEKIVNDYDLLLDHISNENTFYRELPFISLNFNVLYINKLFDLLFSSKVDEKVKTNILKVIYYSNKCGVKYLNKLLALITILNNNQKLIVYEIILNIHSKKVTNLLNMKGIDNSLYIRIALKNYNGALYNDVHKKITKLKINYSDSDGWFEVEDELINYFKRKEIDDRLLIDLKYFLLNGLSSNSRYKIVKILHRFSMLNNEEIHGLGYDSNYKTRRFIKRISSCNK